MKVKAMYSHVVVKTKIKKLPSGQYVFRLVSGGYTQQFPYFYRDRESAQKAATAHANGLAKHLPAYVVSVDSSDIINF